MRYESSICISKQKHWKTPASLSTFRCNLMHISVSISSFFLRLFSTENGVAATFWALYGAFPLEATAGITDILRFSWSSSCSYRHFGIGPPPHRNILTSRNLSVHVSPFVLLRFRRYVVRVTDIVVKQLTKERVNVKPPTS